MGYIQGTVILIALLSFTSPRVDLSGHFQNLVLFKTDSDFDSTKPIYLPGGQTVALFGTFFNPRLSLMPSNGVRIFYEIELGLSTWSGSSVEWRYGALSDTFRYKHRQIYLEADVRGKLIRGGYQHFKDPTGLFLNHWLGGIRADVGRPLELSLIFAQVPDQTFEGWNFDETNFTHDIFTGGLLGRRSFSSGSVEYGLIYLYDGDVIRRPKNLFAPLLHFERDWGRSTFVLDFVAQAGWTRKGAFGEETEWHLGGAIQVYNKWMWNRTGLRAYLLILSPDDPYYHNETNYGFLYSGKCASDTVILTEDELRDLGTNLDERIGEEDSGFYLIRSGLGIGEIDFYYNFTESLNLSLAGAFAFALEKANALGNVFLGGELNLIIKYNITSIIYFEVLNAVFIPYGMGAFVNTVDPDGKRPLYLIEGALGASF